VNAEYPTPATAARSSGIDALALRNGPETQFGCAVVIDKRRLDDLTYTRFNLPFQATDDPASGGELDCGQDERGFHRELRAFGPVDANPRVNGSPLFNFNPVRIGISTIGTPRHGRETPLFAFSTLLDNNFV
jgi:hypothetical protein